MIENTSLTYMYIQGIEASIIFTLALTHQDAKKIAPAAPIAALVIRIPGHRGAEADYIQLAIFVLGTF